VLSFQGATPGVSGVGVATFYEPRFDFALPFDLLEACAATGANWILHDGETEMRVTFSAATIREFLEALRWATQVGELEEQATTPRYRVLPEPR
jgi:hypothetical protein